MRHLLSTFFLFLIACAQVDSQTISPDAFEKAIQEKPGLILDVRTPDEYEESHLANATNINFYDKDFKAQIAKYDKSLPVYVYCQRGGRSAKAKKILKENGFATVYELDGGLNAWEDSGKQLIKSPKKEPVEMTLDDYQKVINSQKLVVVDFSAKWCGPCRQLSPLLDKIGKQRAQDVKVVMIDVDANETVTRHNNIEELPTLAWYKNGKLVLRMIGLQPEKEINATIDKFLKD